MLRLRDIMTTELVAVDPELPLSEAMELLARHHIGGAPVVAGGKAVGVISATDLLSFAASTPGVPTAHPEQPEWGGAPEETTTWEEGDEPPGTFFSELWSDAGEDVATRLEEVSAPEWDKFADHTVAEAMTSVVCSVPSDTPVEHAAELMRKAAIHRMLVIDDGVLKGIVTLTDIAGAVADHRLTRHTYVFGPPTDVERHAKRRNGV